MVIHERWLIGAGLMLGFAANAFPADDGREAGPRLCACTSVPHVEERLAAAGAEPAPLPPRSTRSAAARKP